MTEQDLDHLPTGSPPVETSGHAEVDAAMNRLDELDSRPVAEHVSVLEDVLVALRRALSDAGTPAG